MTDKTYIRDFANKKTASISAATVRVNDFDGTNAIDIFNLPEKALVTNTYVITESAGNTGLTLDVSIGATVIVNDADVDTTNDFTESATNNITGTGKTVSVKPSVEVTSGEFTIIVEYIEYTLNTNMLTNYSRQ
jgi:hypothetical protein